MDWTKLLAIIVCNSFFIVFYIIKAEKESKKQQERFNRLYDMYLKIVEKQ